MSRPTYTLEALADEVMVCAKLVEREGNLNSSVPTSKLDEARTNKAQMEEGHPRIEELV